MKRIMDKLLSKIKLNKKILMFLLIISIIAFISGSIFVVLLDKSDKAVINTYFINFINDLAQNKIDYIFVLKNSLISNIILILSIWLLGISVVGIPIVLFLHFSQIFTFGFGIASIILNYKFKGLILALIYTFPNCLVYILMLLVLTSYSIMLSIKLIITIFKKKQLDFKVISSKYAMILLTSFIISMFYSLYEAFILPNIIKLIIPILK